MALGRRGSHCSRTIFPGETRKSQVEVEELFPFKTSFKQTGPSVASRHLSDHDKETITRRTKSAVCTRKSFEENDENLQKDQRATIAVCASRFSHKTFTKAVKRSTFNQFHRIREFWKTSVCREVKDLVL